MASLKIKIPGSCRWDLVALGEVMLRLDPGDYRVSTARSFRRCEIADMDRRVTFRAIMTADVQPARRSATTQHLWFHGFEGTASCDI